MALRVYCDESDTPGRVFTLAGWVSVPSAWRSFNTAWREMLTCHGPRPVRTLHMIDLAGRRGNGEFRGWSKKERLSMIDRAADILLDETLMSIPYAVAISIDEAALCEAFPAWNLSRKDMYLLCFRSLMWQVMTHGVEMGISFVMDENKVVEMPVTQSFNEAKDVINEEAPGKISGISFENDAVVMPLQAADFLAYEVRRGILNRRRDETYIERPVYSRLKERRHIFRCYGRRFLRYFRESASHDASLEQLITRWHTVDAPEED